MQFVLLQEWNKQSFVANTERTVSSPFPRKTRMDSHHKTKKIFVKAVGKMSFFSSR